MNNTASLHALPAINGSIPLLLLLAKKTMLRATKGPNLTIFQSVTPLCLSSYAWLQPSPQSLNTLTHFKAKKLDHYAEEHHSQTGIHQCEVRSQRQHSAIQGKDRTRRKKALWSDIQSLHVEISPAPSLEPPWLSKNAAETKPEKRGESLALQNIGLSHFLIRSSLLTLRHMEPQPRHRTDATRIRWTKLWKPPIRLHHLSSNGDRYR